MFFAALALVLTPEAQSSNGDRWPVPNLSRASTRAELGSPIDPSSVSRLRVVWRFRFAHSNAHYPLKAPETIRGVVATPIVAADTDYIQDAMSAVYAINRSTGASAGSIPLGPPISAATASYSSGSVYGSTDTTVFALSAQPAG